MQVLSFIAVAALALVIAGAVFAEDSFHVASDLGTILASEEACGLAYDQAAIEAFIKKEVPPEEMGFAGQLSFMTDGARYSIEEMSQSSLTAHCTAVRQTAASYGFVK